MSDHHEDKIKRLEQQLNIAVLALQEIQGKHKHNVASSSPFMIHAICYEALEQIEDLDPKE